MQRQEKFGDVTLMIIVGTIRVCCLLYNVS